MGKSTALDIEAESEGATVLKVREFVTRPRTTSGGTLFLDALDEYRSDGAESLDKAYRLGAAIVHSGASRWRLSCRAEDWRKEPDLEAVRAAAEGTEIVVAQLLPLDYREARAILVVLEETDPDGFLKKAEDLGAAGFLETPLGLKLLHKALTDSNDVPRTRTDLFRRAIDQLAQESNPTHSAVRRDRASRDRIVDAAGRAFLMLLLSGSRAIWRSGAAAPNETGDERAFLPADDLGLDPSMLGDALDTPLFRGEGAAFEPIHRTVAEYLAGLTLATAVAGTRERAALPLGRALAFLTGTEQRAPTELRGLYAWFAIHLCALCGEAVGRRLVIADPFTVVAYGDASRLSGDLRRQIVASLGQDDPYFLNWGFGTMALGGLSGDDVAAELAAMLAAPPDDNHSRLALFEILQNGRPIPSLLPLLRSIALDPSRTVDDRRQSAEAWLNGAEDKTAARRELLQALEGEAVSSSREGLRVRLAADLPIGALSLDELKAILASWHTRGDHHRQDFFHLSRRLQEAPPVELFDAPLADWLEGYGLSPETEVTDCLHGAFATALKTAPALAATRVWRWTANTSLPYPTPLPREAATALVEWLGAEPERHADYFDAIVTDCGENAWRALELYSAHAGRPPSLAMLRRVLTRADANAGSPLARGLLGLAVKMVLEKEMPTEAFWETYESVSLCSDADELLRRLSIVPLHEWQINQRTAAPLQRARLEAERLKRVAELQPRLAELRAGRAVADLLNAAKIYFSHGGVSRFERLVAHTDRDIAGAIAEGWKAAIGAHTLDATMLGKAVGEGPTFNLEWIILAGLDRFLAEGRLDPASPLPVTAALVVLKSPDLVHDEKGRKQLERWAFARIDRDARENGEALLTFWRAAIDAGATDLPGLWRNFDSARRDGAAPLALVSLLKKRPALPPAVLRSALRASMMLLAPARLLELANAAVANGDVVNDQRKLWTLIAFALHPSRNSNAFAALDDGWLLHDNIGDNFLRPIESLTVSESERVVRDASLIHALGRHCAPADMERSGFVPRKTQLAMTVLASINGLAASPAPDAGRTIAELVRVPGLAPWLPLLHHARATHARTLRDVRFQYPPASAVREALAGGEPATAADLRALVVEELHRLSADLHGSDSTPWKSFWNIDQKTGTPMGPRAENDCRDYILERLRDRLHPYRVGAVTPEVRRSEGTRADIVVTDRAGHNIPIEIKRHSHRDVWTAAATQLQGYSADVGAGGFGIYLVLWFGADARSGTVPGRPAGGTKPTSAEEMTTMLCEDLVAYQLTQTDAVVFDVSDPRVSGPERTGSVDAFVREVVVS
jgi:hypothetical protein